MPLPDLMPSFKVPGLPDHEIQEDQDGAPIPEWLWTDVLFEHWKGGLYLVQGVMPMHEEGGRLIVVYKQVRSGALAARFIDDFLAQIAGPTREYEAEHGPTAVRLRFEPVRYAPDLCGTWE
jgi:uncharacterized protein DUF1653